MAREREYNTDDRVDPLGDELEMGRGSRSDPASRAFAATKRRRWVVVGLFVALIGLLPNLIGWLGFHQPLIDYVATDFEGTVQVNSLTTGWLQPVQLTGITVNDRAGQTLLNVEQISTSKSLFQLLTGSDYGIVTVKHPDAYCVLRPKGSNWEDALASYLQSDSEEPTLLPDVQINIESGQASLRSTMTTQSWSLEDVSGAVRLGAAEAPLLVELAASIDTIETDSQGQSANSSPGTMSVACQVDAGNTTLEFQSADLAIESSSFPLGVVAPFLERNLGPIALGGHINGKAQAYYNALDQSLALKIERLDGSQVGIASARLGSDQVAVRSFHADGELQLTPRLIAAKQFVLNSELGNVNADGSLDLVQLMRISQSQQQDLQLLDTPFQVEGRLDLARVLAMLPTTLQLHDDLVVESGTLAFQVGSRVSATDNDYRRLIFNMDTANVKATRGPQTIIWSKPLRLVGAVGQRGGQLEVENLDCVSEFFRLQGSGNWEQAAFKVSGNLETLGQRLGQFVDLQQTELGGILEGEFGWRVLREGASTELATTAPLPIEMGGSLTVSDPLIKIPAYPKWEPGTTKVQWTGKGKAIRPMLTSTTDRMDAEPTSDEPSLKIQLDEGGIQLDVGSERAVATLSEPIGDLAKQTRFHAQTQLTGRLERWQGHLQHFIDLGQWRGSGKLNLVSNAVISLQSIRLNQLSYQVEQLGLEGYGMRVAEPLARGEGTAVVDFNSASLAFSDLTLIANSIAARARDLQIAASQSLQLTGDVAFRANVNRVADWFELSPNSDSIFWFGEGEGSIRFLGNEPGIAMQIESSIKDFAVAKQTTATVPAPTGQAILNAANPQRQWLPLWQESLVQLKGKLVVGNDYDRLTFIDTAIDSAGLTGTMNGSIADFAETMTMDLEGEYRPDWNQINGLIDEYIGQAVKFQGNRNHTISIKGPLFPKSIAAGNSIVAQPQPWVPLELQGAANLGWEAGSIFGLSVGESQLEVVLDGGQATVSTDGIPLAGGSVQFEPVIDLRSPQPVMKLGWTRLIDQVELKPETARRWLSYVAPLAADATSAQGQFTIDVGEANVPLTDPVQIQARGAVKLSNVVIGAGPLAEQLIATVTQVRQLLKPEARDRDLRTWLRMGEQTIPVVIRDQRVFHDQVQFTHKDLTIKTRGSVGFDQSLQMLAEIPIADDWIAGKDYLAGLQGQSITVPISGTVSAPRIDKSAVERLSRELVKQAAAGALNSAIEKNVNPKLNEFQQKFNDKINGRLNQFQQDLNEKLRIGGGEGAPILPNLIPRRPPNANQENDADPARELLQGIGDLLKGNGGKGE